MKYKTDLPDNVTEVFNDGKQAYYKVNIDFSNTFNQDTQTCSHLNVSKEEHLTGEGSMEYVEWYDNKCEDCGLTWTSNE